MARDLRARALHGLRALPLLLLLSLAACNQKTSTAPQLAPLDPTRLLGERAYTETAALVAIGPRVSGTPAAAQAANHLAERLRALGLAVEIDTFEEETPQGPVTFHNVIGTLAGDAPGSVVLLSHFDTKADIAANFVGANDSGSSSGLLIALAEALRDQWTGRPSLIVAFVDGEECRHAYSFRDGLHGSRRLAANLASDTTVQPIQAVILLDMIGDRDLTVTIPRNATPALVAAAFAAAEAEGCRHQFSLYPGEIIDDHVPFLERGIPAIDLIDFHYGSAPGKNDYWHTPHDTLDKLSPASLQTVGRVVIRMLDQPL